MQAETLAAAYRTWRRNWAGPGKEYTAGVLVWRDMANLRPGEDWRATIRHAITDNALVFIACFSKASLARGKSYQNEEITLAIEKPDVADCILKLDEGTFPGKMDPGGEIEFEGTAKAFTKDPYVLTFEVTKVQVVGWTGKNAPARPAQTAKKKAQ